MNHFITEPVVHRSSNDVEPVRTEPVRTEPTRTQSIRTEPARTEPTEPAAHRGSNGVEPVAAPPVEPARNEDMVPRTSDLSQSLQSKPFEPGKN